MCRWASQMFCFTHSLLGAPAWTTITHNHKEYVEENTQRVIACFWTIYGKALKSYHLQHIMDIVKFIWRNQQIQLDCTISCSYRKKLPHTYMHWNPKKGNTESEICHTPLCSWDYITLCCFTHKHAHSHFPAMQGFFWTFLKDLYHERKTKVKSNRKMFSSEWELRQSCSFVRPWGVVGALIPISTSTINIPSYLIRGHFTGM